MINFNSKMSSDIKLVGVDDRLHIDDALLNFILDGDVVERYCAHHESDDDINEDDIYRMYDDMIKYDLRTTADESYEKYFPEGATNKQILCSFCRYEAEEAIDTKDINSCVHYEGIAYTLNGEKIEDDLPED